MLMQYSFGDASGGGFGASWESKGSTNYRWGVWGSDSNGKLSNYRELRNLVDSIEEIGRKDDLGGVELYFFTDNSTAERAFYKGSSTSELLHQLISRLKLFEMNYGCKIVLVHVAGTRMISQGTDGLSRGNMTEGVMVGKAIKDFIPIHKSPLT